MGDVAAPQRAAHPRRLRRAALVYHKAQREQQMLVSLGKAMESRNIRQIEQALFEARSAKVGAGHASSLPEISRPDPKSWTGAH